jgi:hypothetical protein
MLLVDISIFDDSANFIATKVDASQLPLPTLEKHHMTLWHPPMVVGLPYLEGLVLGGLVL